MKKPQPRNSYSFHLMQKDSVKKILIPDDKPIVGVRARCAAYAYARRSGEGMCTETSVTRSGRTYLLIRKL